MINSTKFNFYGIGAIDSNSAEDAYTYDTPQGGIVAGAIWISKNYILSPFYAQSTLDSMRFNNNFHQYATDEAWASKISYISDEIAQFVGE